MYIGLSGKLRSGKDLSAKLITELVHPNKVIIANFSDPLYDVLNFACDTFGLSREKDREFLQLVGDFGRRRDKEVFVKIIQKKIDAVKQYPELSIIIPDVRFPNEADLLKKNGFTIIRIERPEEERVKHVADHENQSHSSENSLKEYNFDYTVYNDSTTEDLKTRLSLIVNNLSMDI